MVENWFRSQDIKSKPIKLGLNDLKISHDGSPLKNRPFAENKTGLCDDLDNPLTSWILHENKFMCVLKIHHCCGVAKFSKFLFELLAGKKTMDDDGP